MKLDDLKKTCTTWLTFFFFNSEGPHSQGQSRWDSKFYLHLINDQNSLRHLSPTTTLQTWSSSPSQMSEKKKNHNKISNQFKALNIHRKSIPQNNCHRKKKYSSGMYLAGTTVKLQWLEHLQGPWKIVRDRDSKMTLISHSKWAISVWAIDFGITKTCLYNFDTFKPHFYIVKLEFTGVYIIFLISAQKHRLWVLVRTASLRQF